MDIPIKNEPIEIHKELSVVETSLNLAQNKIDEISSKNDLGTAQANKPEGGSRNFARKSTTMRVKGR